MEYAVHGEQSTRWSTCWSTLTELETLQEACELVLLSLCSYFPACTSSVYYMSDVHMLATTQDDAAFFVHVQQ